MTKNKPISEQIRDRIKTAGDKYFSNSNISKYIMDGEKELLINEVQEKFESVLDSLLIDRENDPNSMDTGRRLAKMYVNDLFSGRYEAPPKVTAFPNIGKKSFHGMLTAKVELRSVCSHHFQAVKADCWIGIIPNEEVIGLSKYTRLAQWLARRGTLQEELTVDIANAIQTATNSEHVGVHIVGTHGCMENRGVCAHDSSTSTTILRGEFLTDGVKSEFFNTIKLQNIRCS